MEIRDPELIRRRRLAKRFTQRDVAHLARRSQAAVQQVESGKMKTISEAFAMGIAFALDCDWEDLFIDHEHKVAPNVEGGTRNASHRTGAKAASTHGRRLHA
ncbi:helix-turn-helix transcriptional regulator [Paenarthrobacter sp. NPDC089989]|uniref:helix-turn-helix transcriptional regulator n=1 Tax=unclassified Paenarthrobacter TaxID=2634190 RepID=UPI00380120AB